METLFAAVIGVAGALIGTSLTLQHQRMTQVTDWQRQERKDLNAARRVVYVQLLQQVEGMRQIMKPGSPAEGEVAFVKAAQMKAYLANLEIKLISTERVDRAGQLLFDAAMYQTDFLIANDEPSERKRLADTVGDAQVAFMKAVRTELGVPAEEATTA